MNNHPYELVINYHVTEVCNYSCKFCYAKWDRPNEIHSSGQDAELMLEKLANHFFERGSKKVKAVFRYKTVRINFAGGEPLILKNRFTQLIQKATSLGFNLSLITNGHFLTSNFIEDYGAMFSMIGISFDSQSQSARKKIGRIDRIGKSFESYDLIKAVTHLRKVKPSIKIKINTVVNSVNYLDSFEKIITKINPDKWKIFKVLPVVNNNLIVSDEQFSRFLERHASLERFMVVENNEAMTNSYLMINPQGRFYQNSLAQNGYRYGDLILDVGVEKALEVCEINWEAFNSRYRKASTISLISEREYKKKMTHFQSSGAIA